MVSKEIITKLVAAVVVLFLLYSFNIFPFPTLMNDQVSNDKTPDTSNKVDTGNLFATIGENIVQGEGYSYFDNEEGKGATVQQGNKVAVRYIGFYEKDSVVFDTNFDAGTTLDFVVGNNQVIRGFEEGVIGMKSGGTRTIRIEPSAGYAGATQLGRLADEVIIFVVSIVSVE